MGRPREFDEAQVIDAAVDVFWDRGYQGASMARLTGATSLQKGSLYGAFADKRALFLRALDRYVEMRAEEAAKRIGRDKSPMARLRALLDDFARDCSGAPGERGCLISNTALELLPGDDEVRARIRRAFDGMETLFAGFIAAAKRSGEVRRSLDERAAARLLVTTIQGLRVMGKLSQPLVDARATIDLVLRAFS